MRPAVVVFRNAQKSTNGGAIYYVTGGSSGLTLVPVKCKLENNKATELGGVIASYFGTVRLDDCDIIQNEALGGGGLWATGQGAVFVSGGSFVGNSANIGGGLYIRDGRTVLLETQSCPTTLLPVQLLSAVACRFIPMVERRFMGAPLSVTMPQCFCSPGAISSIPTKPKLYKFVASFVPAQNS